MISKGKGKVVKEDPKEGERTGSTITSNQDHVEVRLFDTTSASSLYSIVVMIFVCKKCT